jgi:hypothetical protein
MCGPSTAIEKKQDVGLSSGWSCGKVLCPKQTAYALTLGPPGTCRSAELGTSSVDRNAAHKRNARSALTAARTAAHLEAPAMCHLLRRTGETSLARAKGWRHDWHTHCPSGQHARRRHGRKVSSAPRVLDQQNEVARKREILQYVREPLSRRSRSGIP